MLHEGMSTMTTTSFSKAVRAFFQNDISASTLAIEEAARRLDWALAKQIEDAEWMLERFTRYARDLKEERRHNDFNSPFGSSTLRDLEKRSGELAALETNYRTLVNLLVPQEARAALLEGRIHEMTATTAPAKQECCPGATCQNRRIS